MSEQQPVSVTQALQFAKEQLEGISLRVIGEISGFKGVVGNYSAVYFTLVDDKSTLNCLIWNSVFEDMGVKLENGMLVEAVGKFNIYPKKGSLSFSIAYLQPAGEGLLRAQVAQRLERLQREGLTDASRKKPIPEFPTRIGVVTSPQGKVIHDVIRTLKRRFRLAEVLFFGTKVEGVDAPESIAHALDVADQAGCDVILLVRGGGSYEDLLPFSSDEVAYAIARARTPIVSGIGHEPDVTIADYIADRRASTPTAAAEAVSPSGEQLKALLNTYRRSCAKGLTRSLMAARHKLAVLEARDVLRDPRYILSIPSQHIDTLTQRLDIALPRMIEQKKHRYTVALNKMTSVGRSLTKPYGYGLSNLGSKLDSLSPLKVLTRGYAAIFDEGGNVITRAHNVATGDSISVKMLDGTLKAQVVSKEEGENNE